MGETTFFELMIRSTPVSSTFAVSVHWGLLPVSCYVMAYSYILMSCHGLLYLPTF